MPVHGRGCEAGVAVALSCPARGRTWPRAGWRHCPRMQLKRTLC